jgi:hypothetical protein
MSETPEIARAADPATALAAAAGVAELAAAAAVETAEGDGLLAALLRHEIALGHQLGMQFAAAGNAALEVALAPGADEAAAKAADRTAARLGGAVARVMGHVRLALLSAAALPAATEEKWIGVCFEGEALCTPEEAERRLAAAKAARAAARGTAAPGRAASEARASTPAEQERIAAGHVAAGDLAAEAGVSALALAAAEWDRVRLFLRHELAAAHRLVMRFGGRAGRLLALARPEDERVEALRLASAAARLMARGRQALATLPRLAPGPGGGSRASVGYYWIGERELFRGQMTEDRGQKASGPDAEPSPASPGLAAGTFCLPSSVVCPPKPSSGFRLLNRGKLKNGNPSGDYLAAARCGACTRAGHACRQPAMKNGRCRFHGGKSTGPRTAAGLANSRAARRTHGGYSAEIIDLRKAAAAHAKRVAALAGRLGGQKTDDRGQKVPGTKAGAMRPVLVLPAGTLRPLSSVLRPPAGTFCPPSSVLRLLNPAGHGVHPLFLMASSRQRKAG